MSLVAPHAGAGLVGGLMIGLAAALMLLGLGRIAGVSGLLARAAGMAGGERAVALAFVIGLPLGAGLVAALGGVATLTMPAMTIAGCGAFVGGGILVGFGTRLGSGCTSGHGICGLARLSPRSAVATGLFMTAGFATVALSHVIR